VELVERRNMSLNIKNAATHALAVQVARLTGESLTEAVTTSLRERLARIEQPDELANELLQIGQDCARHLGGPWRTMDHGALLYDEKGLPR
jgi:antitoxin VapB